MILDDLRVALQRANDTINELRSTADAAEGKQ
jgi:hypothetical protein